MSKVKNRGVITRLSRKILTARRKKNIIAVLAIALTAVLFTTIFTIGGNMLHTNTENSLIQVGTRTHAGYKNVTMAEYEKLLKDKKIKDLSYNIFIGFTTNQELNKLQGEARYFEELDAKNGFAWPTTGRLPQKGLEAAMGTVVLDALGIPHQLGEKVTLELMIHGEVVTETFTLCGFWEGYETAGAQEIALSREYCEKMAPLETVPFYENEKALENYDTGGYINPSFNFANSWNIEKKVEELNRRCGFDPQLINSGVNWVYGFASVDMETLMLIAAVLLLILVSGYLIIYNVFYLNVFSDIRFYGLLKTIGTTGKQLRKIVYRQAWHLCLIGIPLGLVLGWLVGRVLTPVIMSMMNMGDAFYTVNPLIFLGSALFAWFTVWISCRKPCKIAAKVSPIEAVKYTEAGGGIRKKQKNTRRNSLWNMAASNLRRNGKKTVLVVCSCALSMILLNSVYTIVTGFDMDKFLRNSILTDFSVTDATIGNYTGRASVIDGVTEEFQKELEKQPSIKELGYLYLDGINHKTSREEWKVIEGIMNDERYREEFTSGFMKEAYDEVRRSKALNVNLYGVNEMAFGKIFSNDTLDWEKFKTGNYIICNSFDSDLMEQEEGIPFVQPGDQVELELPAGGTKVYEVLAVGEIPYAIGCRYFTTMGLEYILPEEEFQRISGGKQPLRAIFDVEEDQVEAMEQWLAGYIEGVDPNLQYEAKSTYVKEFENIQRVYLLTGAFLSFILALIGILNFINVMVTSILARRQELAMMESIGMTGRQQKRMLQYEGLAYGLSTMAVSATVGMVIGYGIVQLVAGQMWMFTWHFTVLPLAICLPILLIISLLVPVVCYKKICTTRSVVDRLRISE